MSAIFKVSFCQNFLLDILVWIYKMSLGLGRPGPPPTNWPQTFIQDSALLISDCMLAR